LRQIRSDHQEVASASICVWVRSSVSGVTEM
jgi:hypothetical protein